MSISLLSETAYIFDSTEVSLLLSPEAPGYLGLPTTLLSPVGLS